MPGRPSRLIHLFDTDSNPQRRRSILIVVAPVTLFSVAFFVGRPEEWAGALLFWTTFVWVVADREASSQLVILVSVLITVAAHHLVAIADAFVWTIQAAQPDASTFHNAAVQIAQSWNLGFGIDYVFYENLLAGFYLLGGPSRFLGNELSVAAYTASCLLILRLSRPIEPAPARAACVLLFGLLPSAVALGSITLREPWQLMLLLSVVVFGSKATQQHSWSWLLLAVGAATGLALLHKMFIFYSVVLLGLIGVYMFAMQTAEQQRSRLLTAYGIGLSLMLAGSIYLVFATDMGRKFMGNQLANQDLLSAIEKYRAHIDREGSPRTGFSVDFTASSLFSAIYSSLKIYLHYLFAPIGYKMQDFRDWYALTEALMRSALIGAIMVGWRSIHWPGRWFPLLLVTVYVTLTFTFSLGTTNYGQALRHHVLTNWIIILLGVPVLATWLGWRKTILPATNHIVANKER